jgi:hypothetical protein
MAQLTLKQEVTELTLLVAYTDMFKKMEYHAEHILECPVLTNMMIPMNAYGCITKRDVTIFIMLSKDVEKRPFEKLITLAHELGHLWEIRNLWEGDFDRYHAFASGSNMWNYEFQAWLYSVQFLKQVGFTQWRVFMDKMVLPHMQSFMSEKDIRNVVYERLWEEIREEVYTSGVNHA